MKRSKPLSPMTRDTLAFVGALIREERTHRKWTQQELASRIGVTRQTVIAAERGDPQVSAGTLFELAVISGVEIAGPAGGDIASAKEAVTKRLQLLPAQVRTPRHEINDDF